MSFLATLASAFKGGGGGSHVPLQRSFASPWATVFESPRLPQFDYPNAVREGYLANPVAQRSVRIVAEGVGGAPLAADDPALEKLVRGSAGTTPLLEVLAAQLLLHGNAYVQVIKDAAGAPVELFPLRPERVSVIAGADGWPTAFAYKIGGEALTIAPEDEAGWPNLVHLKAFNPADDHYGAGCLAAAAQAVSVHNAASRWNQALLDNAARPSGALVYAPGDSAPLAPEQYDRLKQELLQAYQGAGNAGRPMLLEGGLSWQSMALSPADMDFAGLKAAAARDIALAFGVPPMLLGLPGDNTYANYREANRALWRLTLLPLLGKILGGLEEGLGAWFPHGKLAVDLDRVLHVVEGDGVDGVDLVALGIEVGVEPVHDHHLLIRLRPPIPRVDDHRAVHAAGNVLGERADVAVVEVQAERLGAELVDRALARLDHTGADPGYAVHLGGVKAVEVDRVGVRRTVDEPHPDQIALGGPQSRPRDAAVVGPGRIANPRRDLDLLVLGDHLVLAQDPAAGQPPRPAVVEVTEDRGRVEPVQVVIDDVPDLERRPVHAAAVDRRHAAVAPHVHAAVAPHVHAAVAPHVHAAATRSLARRGRGAVQSLVRHRLVQHRQGDARGGGAADQATPAEPFFGVAHVR